MLFVYSNDALLNINLTRKKKSRCFRRLSRYCHWVNV